MILPIYTYGQPVLRQRAAEIEGDSPELQTLIDNMIETMHGATGLGLAAPQVGQALRLFVADLSGLADDLAEEIRRRGNVLREPFFVFVRHEISIGT